MLVLWTLAAKLRRTGCLKYQQSFSLSKTSYRGGVRHFENSPSSARVINARVRDWKLFKRFPPSSYHCMMMTFMSTNWSSSGHPSNHPIYTGQYRNGWKSYLPENAILAGTRLQKQLPTSQPMNPQECCSGWRTQSLQGHDFKDRT